MGFLDWMKGAAVRNRNDDQAAGWQSLGVYFYRADGRYPPATWTQTPQQFVELIPRIRKHLADRLEVRITNGDDHLLFHATGRGVEWDGIGLTQLLARADRQPHPAGGKRSGNKPRRWER